MYITVSKYRKKAEGWKFDFQWATIIKVNKKKVH